jgi:hypothetical protein
VTERGSVGKGSKKDGRVAGGERDSYPFARYDASF